MKLAALLFVASVSDCVGDVPIDGLPCPCVTGWHCDTTTQTCVADTPPPPDAGPDATPGSAYRHTIRIDGVNDFFSSFTQEAIVTTSNGNGYNAFLSWDADYLYVGYEGALIGQTPDDTKGFVIYLDVDPAAAAGAAQAETFGTQVASFPAGFRADYSFRWMTVGDDWRFKHYTGGTWNFEIPNGLTTAYSQGFVEARIPLALIGRPTRVGIVGLWQNSGGTSEYTFAGWYPDAFSDGDHRAGNPAAIAHWLDADLTTSPPPASPSRKR